MEIITIQAQRSAPVSAYAQHKDAAKHIVLGVAIAPIAMVTLAFGLAL